MDEFADGVTIVIPCYNYGRYLRDAVNSALAQTVAPRSVIVVNDGSTDDTAEVVRSFGSVVTGLNLPHMGLCAARNAGLQLVQTRFVVFLDADDALVPSYLHDTLEAWNAASDPKPAFVYTQRQDFETGMPSSQYPVFDPARLKFKNYIMISALLLTQDAKAQGFDPLFSGGLEDYDFFMGLAAAGRTGLLLDKPLLRVRSHQGSRTIACGSPLVRWALMCRLLQKYRNLYSNREASQFMRTLRGYVADRFVEQRDSAQSFAERATVLFRLVRFRAAPRLIWGQLRFVWDGLRQQRCWM